MFVAKIKNGKVKSMQIVSENFVFSSDYIELTEDQYSNMNINDDEPE